MPRAKVQVVVLGGGLAGLETAFLVKHRLHDEAEITIVSDTGGFVFRPSTLYVPFGLDPEGLRVPLGDACQRQGIRLVLAKVRGVDPAWRRVDIEGAPSISFDRLVIATGAAACPEEVPGLAEHASMLGSREGMLRLRVTLEEILARAKGGHVTRLLFLVPPNNACPGPLYEMALMVETWLRRHLARGSAEIELATHEHAFLEMLGPRVHQALSDELAERKITGFTGHAVREVAPSRVAFENGSILSYDVLISFGPHAARVRYEGLAADERGFLRTELESRAVRGVEGIYAPGDAGDFPLKQAFLACLQADATAEDIVAEVTHKPVRVRFEPLSMDILDALDRALFVQVPLRLTGDPRRPLVVREDAGEEYKVGVSPLWRLGKKMLGFYLPMRFAAGEPFLAGRGWRMMESGLRGILAH